MGLRAQGIFPKDTSSDLCGESWEISGLEANVSVVQNGTLAGEDLRGLIKKFKGDLLGTKVYQRFGDEFPLLIKFLDANKNLSIQVDLLCMPTISKIPIGISPTHSPANIVNKGVATDKIKTSVVKPDTNQANFLLIEFLSILNIIVIFVVAKNTPAKQ